MKVVIIISKKMPAALNVKDKLISIHGFEKTDKVFDGNEVHELKINDNEVVMCTVEENAVYLDDIDKRIDADLIIFPTTHKGSAGVLSLTCHVPGNWGKAELGGRDKQLCISPASLLREMFLELNNNKLTGYESSLEQTHHGPYLEKPAMFVEIGSSEAEWLNEEAGKVIAQAITNVLKKDIKQQKCVVVLGGQHYNQAANKVLLKTNYAVSHVCAKHCLTDLDEETLGQAMQKSTDKFEMVVLDWKGLGQHKQKAQELISKLGLRHERLNKL
jgi:D-aminoacyl-tRNA deacylase